MKKLLPVALTLVLLTGCASHYKVTQPSSGKTYYTTKVHHKKGDIIFKDAASGSEVILDAAEITKISKSEFKEATKK